jgi:hypothetical protein
MMMGKHGQKTRWLKQGVRPGWRHAWQVVVDPGTPINQGERLAERYTWGYGKYELFAKEVAGVGACVITFDFKPVPKHAGGGGHDLHVWSRAYYSGNHAAGHAPKYQIYDYNATGWVDIAGMVLSIDGSDYEYLEGRVPFSADYFEDGTDNVRIRILHPVVGGNPVHEFHVNEVGLGTYGTTSTTSTTSSTTTS